MIFLFDVGVALAVDSSSSDASGEIDDIKEA